MKQLPLFAYKFIRPTSLIYLVVFIKVCCYNGKITAEGMVQNQP